MNAVAYAPINAPHLAEACRSWLRAHNASAIKRDKEDLKAIHKIADRLAALPWPFRPKATNLYKAATDEFMRATAYRLPVSGSRHVKDVWALLAAAQCCDDNSPVFVSAESIKVLEAHLCF